MKKTFIFAMFLCANAAVVNAQLKVDSIGRVIVGDNAASMAEGLTVNAVGTHSGSTNLSAATALRSQTTGNCQDNTAIWGEAVNIPFHPTPILPSMGVPLYSTVNCGVYGIAGNNDVNVGVMGGLHSEGANGAGIYGTSKATASTIPSGRYAGFFEGDMKVTRAMIGNLRNRWDGNVSQTYLVTPTLPSLSEMAVKCVSSGTIRPFGSEGASTDAISEPTTFILPDNHLFIDVQSVKNVMPILVETDDCGNEYVNYTELIPVMLKAIQELKAQVELLSGQSGNGSVMMAPQQTSGETASLKAQLAGNARLYQNQPNPFNSQTAIRFSLPENVQDAAICIFDMTGKMLKKMPISSGMESVSISGYELGEGIYLYSLVISGQEIDTKRMIITK